MKALGGLDSKWDPIRKKLVRRLLEEQGMRQGKVLRSYFAQKGGARSKGGGRCNFKGREHVHCRSFHRCCRRRSESSSSSLFVFPFSSVASVLHSPVACACTTSHGAWCSDILAESQSGLPSEAAGPRGSFQLERRPSTLGLDHACVCIANGKTYGPSQLTLAP